MSRIARGTLPPMAQAASQGLAPAPIRELAVICPACGVVMQREHALYRCVLCGLRDRASG